ARSSPSSAPSSGPRALPSSRRLSFTATPPKESQPSPKPSLPGSTASGSTSTPGLVGFPFPLAREILNNYGAGTTPPLSLFTRSVRVALFHPGVFQYETFRPAAAKPSANYVT